MQRIEADSLAEALRLAAALHAGMTRKGTDVPYLSHLLGVASLVVEHGGDTDCAVAALLHDAVEDCEGFDLTAVRERFGERVARIVADCTDTLPGDRPGAKSPWLERKSRYLRHLASAPADSLLVAACDKRHNLASMVADLRREGRSTLRRFRSTPEQQLWYYEEVVRAIGKRVPDGLAAELADLVAELSTHIERRAPD